MAPRTEDLTREISVRPVAYLLTVSAQGEPHAAQVSTSLAAASAEQVVAVTRLGRTSLRNIASGSRISLIWPPSEPTGYTLIVNGVADPAALEAGTAGTFDLRITRAVLHRPGEVPAGSALCGSDCIPLVG